VYPLGNTVPKSKPVPNCLVLNQEFLKKGKKYFLVSKSRRIFTLLTATDSLPIIKKHNMTQSTTTNGYTLATMNSTDVYNYMKRMTRMHSKFATSTNIDCLAEAFIQSYGDDNDIMVAELKRVCIRPGYMTDLDFREMECHVTTSLRYVPDYEAHVN